ncbi:MAG: flagellar filament capping protein FliD, partial [Wujia sp.]
SALTLRDVAERLSNPDSDLYAKKQLYCDAPDCVTGSFRKHASGELPDTLELEIESLAKEQVNTGAYLEDDALSVPVGNYHIFMNTDIGKVPFTVSVKDEDTNRSIQEQLVQNINSRHLDIQASLISEGDSSSILLASKDTGIPSNTSGLYFSFESEDGDVLLDTLSLNHIQTMPGNARFSINGSSHSSASNHISINQLVELDFHRETTAPVNIRFAPDTELLKSEIGNFVDAYNNLVTISERSEPATVGSRNLYHDISGIVNKHREQLASIGLTTDEHNRLVHDNTFTGVITTDDISQLFGSESSLKSDVINSTNRLTLDPMAYINKLIVTYPNAKEKKTTTYTQSVYSGLIYNNYA